MVKNVTVGYTPNDFFYADAIGQGVMPSERECNNLNPYNYTWDFSCNVWFSDNSGNCIKRELCKNRDKAEHLTRIEDNHSSSIEKLMNEKMNYDNVLLNTINLGIGVIFLLVIIYKNFKS
jgi:hypothetical protein